MSFITTKTRCQTVEITANSNSSGNNVIGPLNFHVSESIYTDTEIGSNFLTPLTAINHIDFNVVSVGTITTVTNFNLYIKEVPASNETFTAGAYDTAGYTLVFSGTYTPATTSWVGVDLTTAFTRTAGNNLQVLIERLDSMQHGAYSFRAAQGNNNGAALTTSRRLNSATRPVPGLTSLGVTNFRPQIRLRHITPNDAAVATVYTLGKLPIPFAAPHIISSNIVNNGSNTLTNISVTLDISGANTFSDVQTIASLAPGTSATVVFSAFSPSATGLNTVSVSLPNDDFNGDNVKIVSQEVTSNAYSYAYGLVPSGSVGAVGNTGDFVAMFTSSSPTSVNQVGVNFTTGGLPFRIGIWDKSGTGKPGSLLWESTDQVSTNGVFTLPISPAIPITDTFYIGVRQTSNTNIQFAYQIEIPIRAGTFFYTNPTGNTVWTDFAPGNPYKFMIEPRLTIGNDVGVSTIDNPVSASAIDNCGIVPQATVANFGSNAQAAFDVNFTIKQSGTAVYTDTKQVSLNAGESQAVFFAPFTGSVTGMDSSVVITQLATDGARNNDTVVNSFVTNNYSYSDSTPVSEGYSFANSTPCASLAPLHPSYNWITETTNEVNWGTNGDDNISAALTIPFSFKFFGNDYTQCWVASNGWISFSDPTALTAAVQRTPASIPLAGGIENYIAGVLTNLDLTPGTYADAHTYYGGDASQFVITFEHAHLLNSADNYITFQIILKVNGDIVIQYNDAETTNPVPAALTNFCSVGIENATGTAGIRYRLNGSGGPMFGSPLALQFYTRVGSTVPVTLVDFTVQKANRVNRLSWTTSLELNSRRFVIERGADGRNFAPIGEIAAAGNSERVTNYSFTDQVPLAGLNYYRLKMTDRDNVSKYSAVRSVTNNTPAEISVYPNPVRNILNLAINAGQPGRATISLTDLTGKLVSSTTVLLTAGYNNIPVSAAGIAKGTYLLKLTSTAGSITKKINKL